MQPCSRVWMTHKRRGEDMCPLCYAPLRWIYDSTEWIPCDVEPILVYLCAGNKSAVVKRELLRDVALYADVKIKGVRPVSAHRPHVCTCPDIQYKPR